MNSFNKEDELRTLTSSKDCPAPDLINEVADLANFRHQVLAKLVEEIDRHVALTQPVLGSVKMVLSDRLVRLIKQTVDLREMPPGLPETCYAACHTLPKGQRIIVLLSGCLGFIKTHIDKEEFSMAQVDSLVRSMNDEQGVSPEQEAAMLAGSKAGWGATAARPDFWVGQFEHLK